jgi:hypothetical protein
LIEAKKLSICAASCAAKNFQPCDSAGRLTLPTAPQTMPNTPEAWNRLRARVQAATAGLSDQQLTERTMRLQRRWRAHKRPATFNVLQELHAEQHRRRWS